VINICALFETGARLKQYQVIEEAGLYHRVVIAVGENFLFAAYRISAWCIIL
jgi:hypothetical protein